MLHASGREAENLKAKNQNNGHFAQVKKAVVTYTGIEPVTLTLKG